MVIVMRKQSKHLRYYKEQLNYIKSKIDVGGTT